MKLRIFSLGVLCLFLMALSIRGESIAESFFSEGVQAYTQGDFEKALHAFLRIRNSGVETSEINYNIGNCFFKLGKLGKAVFFYEKALIHSRRDSEIKSNLQLVQSQLKDKIEVPLQNVFLIPFEWIKNILSLWELSLVNVILVWLLLILLSIKIFLWGKALALKTWIYILAVFQLFLLMTWGLSFKESRNKAIILTAEVQVHSGPGESFPKNFKIHEGLKISLLESQGEWSKISLSNGWTGWIKSESYEKIC